MTDHANIGYAPSRTRASVIIDFEMPGSYVTYDRGAKELIEKLSKTGKAMRAVRVIEIKQTSPAFK